MVKESEWEPKSKWISYTFDVLVRISESCVVFIMVHLDITKEGNAITIAWLKQKIFGCQIL